jgi:hypothetical protein
MVDPRQIDDPQKYRALVTLPVPAAMLTDIIHRLSANSFTQGAALSLFSSVVSSHLQRHFALNGRHGEL